MKTIEMSFLPRREGAVRRLPWRALHAETLAVSWAAAKEASAKWLTMEVDEAVEFFRLDGPIISHPLAVAEGCSPRLPDLGQPSPTLSGGEAAALHQAAVHRKPEQGARRTSGRRATRRRTRCTVLDERDEWACTWPMSKRLNPLCIALDDGATKRGRVEHENLDVIAEATGSSTSPRRACEGAEAVVAGTTPRGARTADIPAAALGPSAGRGTVADSTAGG